MSISWNPPAETGRKIIAVSPITEGNSMGMIWDDMGILGILWELYKTIRDNIEIILRLNGMIWRFPES